MKTRKELRDASALTDKMDCRVERMNVALRGVVIMFAASPPLKDFHVLRCGDGNGCLITQQKEKRRERLLSE